MGIGALVVFWIVLRFVALLRAGGPSPTANSNRQRSLTRTDPVGIYLPKKES